MTKPPVVNIIVEVVADCPEAGCVNGSELPPPPVTVIVIGVDPGIVKEVHEADPEHVTVVVPVVYRGNVPFPVTKPELEKVCAPVPPC